MKELKCLPVNEELVSRQTFIVTKLSDTMTGCLDCRLLSDRHRVIGHVRIPLPLGRVRLPLEFVLGMCLLSLRRFVESGIGVF